MDNQVNSFERKTLRLFSIWSLFYDSAASRLLYFGAVYKKIVETLESFGRPLLSQRIRFLDTACGTGEIILRLAQKYPEHEFTGVDFSEAMLQKAITKTSGLKNIKTIHANVRSLPFLDNSFDIVLCSDALHHFAEPEPPLREIGRITKIGGLFLLIDPAVDNLAQKFILKLFVKIWDRPKRYYSRKEIAEFLRKAGFRIETIFTYYHTNFFVCYKI